MNVSISFVLHSEVSVAFQQIKFIQNIMNLILDSYLKKKKIYKGYKGKSRDVYQWLLMTTLCFYNLKCNLKNFEPRVHILDIFSQKVQHASDLFTKGFKQRQKHCNGVSSG